MADQEHLALLKQGVEAWNRWREEHPDIDPNLTKANLSEAHLEKANLRWAHLEGATLGGAHLEKADLYEAHLEAAYLSNVDLKEANLDKAHLEEAFLDAAHLEKAQLHGAHLEGASLRVAHLEEATLRVAHLERANLSGAHLEGSNLHTTHLEGADLTEAFFNNATKLHDIILASEKHEAASLVDVNWGGVNLTVVDWVHVKILGNEYQARQAKTSTGREKLKEERLNSYRRAVRAYRQLAVVLRDQGLNEEADYFAYRAQLLQQVVYWRQRKGLKYIFSWFLYLLAGYGYRPLRSVLWYLVVIIGFALAYHALGNLSLFPPDAFVYSLTSFHGRGFFPGLEHTTSLHDPLIMLASLEAVIGLVIEISFIATFTQRFFGR